MPPTNTELTRQAYDAMNRRDVEWLVERGIREHFRDMDELWESFESFPDHIHDLGDRVIAIGRQRFRGRASGIDVEQQAGVLFHLRDDLVTEIRAYKSVEDALAATGLE